MIDTIRLQQILEDNVITFWTTDDTNDERINITVTIDEGVLIIKRELEESGFDLDDFALNIEEHPSLGRQAIRDIAIELANINNNYTSQRKQEI